MPDELGGVAGPAAARRGARCARGYDDEALAKITHGNWLRVLDETWQPWGRYFRPRRRRAAADAARRGRAVRGARASPSTSAAGTGRDTAELLRRGWRVLAIDREQEAIDRLHALAGPDVGAARDASSRGSRRPTWPACDLVNASFALPFCPPDAFAALWRRIVDSLAPGGRFCGPALRRARRVGADRDRRPHARRGRASCSRRSRSSGSTSSTARATTAIGKRKHWHLFHVVARKRVGTVARMRERVVAPGLVVSVVGRRLQQLRLAARRGRRARGRRRRDRRRDHAVRHRRELRRRRERGVPRPRARRAPRPRRDRDEVRVGEGPRRQLDRPRRTPTTSAARSRGRCGGSAPTTSTSTSTTGPTA